MHNAIRHWDPYLQNGLEFIVVTDHYALVYMVTKTGGDAHQRLARLCMDLQGYTCTVKHRSGEKNLLADAVSRLFRVNDIPPVLTIDELRDDFGPLTEEEKAKFEHFGTEQGFIIETIEDHRRKMAQAMQDQMENRFSQMVTEKPESTKHGRKRVGKKEREINASGEAMDRQYEDQKQEADAFGIVETVTNDQVSSKLMKYITDEDLNQMESDYYQFPIMVAESSVSAENPENVLSVAMQQIVHEGRSYQLHRRR